MTQICRKCNQIIEAPNQYCELCSARQARFYRIQLWLATVVGILTLTWVVAASPRQEALLKSIPAQTIAAIDELMISEVCEMSNSKNGNKTCQYQKTFKFGSCCAERKVNGAKNVITCLLRKGATKLHAALS